MYLKHQQTCNILIKSELKYLRMDVINVTDVMDIMKEVNSTSPHDPVNICILKYRDHASIELIRENE